MIERPLRIYIDTSVFGGYFEDEFLTPTRKLFDEITGGRFIPVISATVSAEIRRAPEHVQELFDRTLESSDFAMATDKAQDLRSAFLKAGVVTAQSNLDAHHVALAFTSNCQAIVSWNFRHIVHFKKIPVYNAIAKIMGYSEIDICSPAEVLDYGA